MIIILNGEKSWLGQNYHRRCENFENEVQVLEMKSHTRHSLSFVYNRLPIYGFGFGNPTRRIIRLYIRCMSWGNHRPCDTHFLLFLLRFPYSAFVLDNYFFFLAIAPLRISSIIQFQITLNQRQKHDLCHYYLF